MKSCVKRVAIGMSRKFSAKVRVYMLIYVYKREKGKQIDEKEWNYDTNDNIYKVYRGHRDANCINEVFIETVVRDSIGCCESMDILGVFG